MAGYGNRATEGMGASTPPIPPSCKEVKGAGPGLMNTLTLMARRRDLILLF